MEGRLPTIDPRGPSPRRARAGRGPAAHRRPAAAWLAFTATALVLSTSACATVSHARKVDIGGYKLKVRCAGKGSPTVVMDAGLGDTSESWSEVWPGVAAFTRVCVYDRAGLGGSDPGVEPRTSQRIANELQGLLRMAWVDGPYVLVGHSFGGLNMRLFASEHPSDVAGLVLVEATHEDYPAREKMLRSPEELGKIESTLDAGPPAARSEFHSLPQSVAEVRAASPLPPVPLVVLTAGRPNEPPALREAWMELQKDLLRLSPRSRQIFAEKSSHYVQFDQPDIVVTTIREVVEAARGRASVAGSGRDDAAPRSGAAPARSDN